MKAEVLAAGADGLRNIFWLSGRQHKDHMAGRFFERLQQRIKSSVGDLVCFVEDINLKAVPGGAVTRRFAQFTDSSMPRLVAASISMTSTEFPARISVQESHTPQGSATGL